MTSATNERPTVLVVDDDAGVRFTLMEVLSEVDVDILKFRSGLEIEPGKAEVVAALSLRLREDLKVLAEPLHAEPPQAFVP